MGKLYKHEKKKKTKAKVLNDNLIITSANKTVNFLMSQIYYEMLWNIQSSTFVLEGYFWQSFTHHFTWPAQLTNISHLIVPLLVFTAVIDFPSVIMDSTATFSKILTPNEKKIISLLLCRRHGGGGLHTGIEVKRSSSVLWQSHCVVFFSQTFNSISLLL